MVKIRLHNSKTRVREDFVPLDPQNVRMYVCGPTVYDRAHIGNGRPVVVFDTLYRLLRHVYGADHVTYVRNFTDVDDKINAEAQRRKSLGRTESLEELIHERTEETIAWYHADMDALGALRPDHEPRATEYIAEMIEINQRLIDSGHAYAKDGHVLFRVRSYADYGALSGRSVDDMIAGARVEVAPFKEDPMDFVLWKPSDADLPGWDSPWGRGRPGWHIECSAMAHKLLGEAFDIHGGGLDLQFPHHENEIAQSCCAFPGKGFATTWLHNEMLQVEGKKMSKSLGNFFTVRDLLDQGYPGEVIRFVYLTTHYRKPMDWTAEKAEQATKTLRKWRTLCHGAKPDANPPEKILEHLADDLNTSDCITWLHRYATAGNAAALLAGAQLMGLLTSEMGSWFSLGEEPLSENPHLNSLLAHRQRLREQKNWSQADQLRNLLNELGVVIADSKEASAGYVEPSFLMRQLMSDISSSYRDNRDMFEKSLNRAVSFGVVEPAPDRKPRAWTEYEAVRLLPKIEARLREIAEELGLMK